MKAILLSILLCCPLMAESPKINQSTPVTQAISTQPLTSVLATPQISNLELHIRAGVILLAQLHQSMASINSEESAKAALATLIKLQSSLQEWGLAFNTMQDIDDALLIRYQEAYLPIIEKFNKSISIQADRLHSAEYYGSQDLLAALVSLVDKLK